MPIGALKELLGGLSGGLRAWRRVAAIASTPIGSRRLGCAITDDHERKCGCEKEDPDEKKKGYSQDYGFIDEQSLHHDTHGNIFQHGHVESAQAAVWNMGN